MTNGLLVSHVVFSILSRLTLGHHALNMSIVLKFILNDITFILKILLPKQLCRRDGANKPQKDPKKLFDSSIGTIYNRTKHATLVNIENAQFNFMDISG